MTRENAGKKASVEEASGLGAEMSEGSRELAWDNYKSRDVPLEGRIWGGKEELLGGSVASAAVSRDGRHDRRPRWTPTISIVIVYRESLYLFGIIDRTTLSSGGPKATGHVTPRGMFRLAISFLNVIRLVYVFRVLLSLAHNIFEI